VKALVTAGGHGTRLRPITHTQNKHLIPIANKEMLAYALDYLIEAGVDEIGIIVNKGDSSIQEKFGNGNQKGVEFTYIVQSAPKGLAHVVKISEGFIGTNPFIFYLGDNILVGGVKSFIKKFEKNNSNCHLVLSKVTDPNRFGVATIHDHKIVKIEEKPEDPESDLAVTGIYIYDNTIFEAVNNINLSERGELEISDAHQYLLDHGRKISFSEITGWWKDTGKPSDLLEANRLVLDNLIDKRSNGIVDTDSNVKGRVSIGHNTSIINSMIRGPVIIGDGCVIENAFVGPYTSIGNDCIIRKSEIEYSIIMGKCNISNVKGRIEASLMSFDVNLSGYERTPKVHRFILGDHSRVEID
jgi:glucose-1-phosphate thymidylyltransferase